ncbi:restriction endonuclease subunit S [Helicobacter canis]|uniref:Type I restriction modification DNA specificity domain-containing protein n=1 Tax=Helicobacter canis NCTC 12740 TaxID=1357399 RepID=V8CKZ9_9HELI|nr:restriction endonuclease subunit S [Helicobacter canis]ETD27705.1 hypothetical protein HMPREF2087_00625 [Helicobacter canis NCTC 12740]
MPLKALQDSTLADSREWQSFANTALSTLAQKELESSSAKNDIEWKSFNFDKVFKYERGKRYKKLDHTSGQIPYISSSALNNGIDNYVNPPSYMKRYNNKITLANSGSVGSCFYHSYEFVASDHCMVVWLKDRELNRYLALFFNAIFEKALKPKYEFSREINHERLMAETFFLPTKDNTIDFNFMESFIKAIEKQHIETLYRFWESKLKAYNAVINGGGVSFTLSEYEEFCKGLKAQDFQFELYRNKISQSLKWKSFKCEELFSVKSNPQLNKDSFSFGENAPYPYFTRTCLNNGIAGYVEYLDEEHKIKGESIAVGMLGMQFFYMQKDFYAGQFTKTLYPKFSGLNATIAQFFIAWLNKNQKIFQGVLVRDFEKTFKETEILLPVLDSNNIDFDFIESFIKAIQKECIKSVVLWQTREAKAYKQVVETLA